MYAVEIQKGAVVDKIVASAEFIASDAFKRDRPGDWRMADDAVQIGWLEVGGVLVAPAAEPAPAPAAPRKLTKLAFLRLLTQAERIAFRQAAKADPVMEDFMALLDLAEDVDKDDQDVVAGLASAEAAGLLSSGRTAEILA